MASIWSIIAKLKFPEMPKPEQVKEIPTQIKELSVSKRQNTIRVILFSSSGFFTTETIGTILNDGDYPIVMINTPQRAGFIMVPGSERWNLTLLKKEIYIQQGYSVGLVFGQLPKSMKTPQNEKVLSSEAINEEDLMLPLDVNDLPRQDTTVGVIDENGEEQRVTITETILSTIATTQWVRAHSGQQVSGVAMIAIFFAFFGGIVALLLEAAFRG